MRTIDYRIIIWSIWSFVCGFICYIVPFQAYDLGIANIEGKTEDLWTIMLAAIISVVLIHHFQLFIGIRHVTWWLVAWCVLSFSMIPVCIVLVDFIFGIPLYRRQFTDIFAS